MALNRKVSFCFYEIENSERKFTQQLLHAGHENLLMETSLDLFVGCGLKE